MNFTKFQYSTTFCYLTGPRKRQHREHNPRLEATDAGEEGGREGQERIRGATPEGSRRKKVAIHPSVEEAVAAEKGGSGKQNEVCLEGK